MKNTFDYYMAGRNIKGMQAGVSVQTAGLGMWLMIILPGYVYFFGAGQAWIAIGLILGTYLSWHLIAGRLGRYSAKLGNIKSVPEYLKYRFHDEGALVTMTASIIIFFFLVFFMIIALGMGGRMLEEATGFDYRAAVIIFSVIPMVYVVMGGYRAQTGVGFVYGTLIFLSLIIIPIIIAFNMSAEDIIVNIINSDAEGGASMFLNIFYRMGEPIEITGIISQLSWGLAISGLPFILTGLMSVTEGDTLKVAARTAIIWSLITIVTACVAGALGRAYMYPEVLSHENMDRILYLDIINKMSADGIISRPIYIILATGMVSAVPAMAGSMLLSASSALTEGIICGVFLKRMTEKNSYILARVMTVLIMVMACTGAVMANGSLIPGFKSVWAGIGCAFLPVVILSLYWKRMNKYGAVAGMSGGLLTVLIWDNAKVIDMISCKETMYEATGISSVLAGAMISTALVLLVSIFTGDVKSDVKKEFDEVKNRIN